MRHSKRPGRPAGDKAVAPAHVRLEAAAPYAALHAQKAFGGGDDDGGLPPSSSADLP
jgi:hypothetical protein